MSSKSEMEKDSDQTRQHKTKGFELFELRWTQSYTEIEIELYFKTIFKVKAIDFVVNINTNYLKVGLKAYPPLIDEILFEHVNEEDCVWVVETNAGYISRNRNQEGTSLFITLAKAEIIKQWPCLFKNEAQKKIKCKQNMSMIDIMDSELKHYSWYQRDWDKRTAEVVLRLESKDGGFVIQLNEDCSAITLSVLRLKTVNYEVRHFHLYLKEKGLIIGEKKFNTVLEFVNHFSVRKFTIISEQLVDSASIIFEGTPLSDFEDRTLYDIINYPRNIYVYQDIFLLSSLYMSANELDQRLKTKFPKLPLFQLYDGPSKVSIDRGSAMVKPFKIKESLSNNIAERMYYVIINSGNIVVNSKKSIGEGSFGKVYKGVWNIDRYSVYMKENCERNPDFLVRNINVALKDFRDGDTEDELDNDTIKDIIQEGCLMVNFNHVNVLRFFGIEVSGSVYSLVLEYMSEGCLLSYIQENKSFLKTNDKLLLEFWLQVLNGMIYLEKKNYIHRDLALKNCLIKYVDDRYIVKVSDFGLMSCGKKSNILDNIKWLPPEVIITKTFSNKSDVWSYGIVGWEIFSLGKMPYYWLHGNVVKVVKDSILNGIIMEKPNLAPEKVYEVMKLCWKMEIESRPTFHELGSLALQDGLNISIKRPCEDNADHFAYLLSRRSMRPYEMFYKQEDGRIYDLSYDEFSEFELIDPIQQMM